MPCLDANDRYNSNVEKIHNMKFKQESYDLVHLLDWMFWARS